MAETLLTSQEADTVLEATTDPTTDEYDASANLPTMPGESGWGNPYGSVYGNYGNYGNFFSASKFVWPTRWMISCCIILATGLAGNAWVIYVGLRQKTARNSPFYLLLMNHSLSCFLLAAFAYPIMLHKGSLGLVRTNEQSQLCCFAFMAMLWWVSSGLLSNGVVAVNRALSCFPHQTVSRVLRGRRATWATMAVIWMMSFLVYGVPYFAYPTGWAVQLFCLPMEEFLLNMNHPDGKIIKHIVRYSCGLSVLVALAMSVMSYISIIWRLYGQECLKGVKTMSAQRKREKLHALGVIVVVFVTFCVCWVPLMWALIWQIDLMTDPLYSLLPMLETALNPLIYVITMPIFRPEWSHRRTRVVPFASNSRKPPTVTGLSGTGSGRGATTKATSSSRL